jgi:hypothetical protein
MKATITKSKSGHYTMTLRNSAGFRVVIREKLGSLAEARAVANAEKASRSGASFADAVGPCGK